MILLWHYEKLNHREQWHLLFHNILGSLLPERRNKNDLCFGRTGNISSFCQAYTAQISIIFIDLIFRQINEQVGWSVSILEKLEEIFLKINKIAKKNGKKRDIFYLGRVGWKNCKRRKLKIKRCNIFYGKNL